MSTLASTTFADLFTFTRASTGTRFNSSGTMVTAAVDAPRFDHDPGASNAARGLLMEGQRTNLIRYSQDMTNASWSKVGCSAALNQSDLFGNANAASRVTSGNTGASGQVRLGQAVTVSGTNAVFWAVLRAGTVDKFRWTLSAFTTAVDCYFDLATGTVPVSPASYATAKIRSLGGGLYLCWVVMPVGADPAGNWLIYGTNASYALNYTLDGTQTFDVLATGVESGNFPTSYIPTVASQVTRSAETAAISGTAFSNWFTEAADSGTLYVEFTMLQGARTDRRILELSDGTANNRISIYENGSAQIIVDVVAGGVTQASLTAHTISSYSATHKLAFAYAANDFAVVVNNGTPATDASGSVPTVDRLHLASDRSGANQGMCHIRKLSVRRVRKSNAELGTITT